MACNEKIGILWDLDGTLLDTLEDLTDAVNYALAVHHCPARSLEQVREFVGNGAQTLIRLALPGKADDPDAMAVLRTFRDYYDTHCQIKTKPYPGIPEAITALADHPMAIVSNKPDAAVKQLSALYFHGMSARGEGADCPRKPAPDMVQQAMQMLGTKHCIYIGDSEVDILTAQNAGIPCLSVTWGFRDREALQRAGGTHFCDDPARLPEIIKEMVGQFHGK